MFSFLVLYLTLNLFTLLTVTRLIVILEVTLFPEGGSVTPFSIDQTTKFQDRGLRHYRQYKGISKSLLSVLKPSTTVSSTPCYVCPCIVVVIGRDITGRTKIPQRT